MAAGRRHGGRPRTRQERLERHTRLYGEGDLPPLGSGFGRRFQTDSDLGVVDCLCRTVNRIPGMTQGNNCRCISNLGNVFWADLVEVKER